MSDQAISSKPSRKMRLSQAEGHPHGAMCYLELGQATGEAVVFVHGLGADLLTWQHCLIPLAARFRVIALDLPGHGRSEPSVGEGSLSFMTRWLDQAFDLLGLEKAHVIGHSMGAKIALGFVKQSPHRLLSLSLISPAGLCTEFHYGDLEAWLSAPSLLAADELARKLLAPASWDMADSLAKSLYQAVSDPLRAEALGTMLAQAKLKGLALSPEEFDWSEVRCPVMALWGDQDQLIGPPEAKNLPHFRAMRVIEGVGHLPHIEAPHQVVAALKEFYRDQGAFTDQI